MRPLGRWPAWDLLPTAPPPTAARQVGGGTAGMRAVLPPAPPVARVPHAWAESRRRGGTVVRTAAVADFSPSAANRYEGSRARNRSVALRSLRRRSAFSLRSPRLTARGGTRRKICALRRGCPGVSYFLFPTAR